MWVKRTGRELRLSCAPRIEVLGSSTAKATLSTTVIDIRLICHGRSTYSIVGPHLRRTRIRMAFSISRRSRLHGVAHKEIEQRRFFYVKGTSRCSIVHHREVLRRQLISRQICRVSGRCPGVDWTPLQLLFWTAAIHDEGGVRSNTTTAECVPFIDVELL